MRCQRVFYSRGMCPVHQHWFPQYIIDLIPASIRLRYPFGVLALNAMRRVCRAEAGGATRRTLSWCLASEASSGRGLSLGLACGGLPGRAALQHGGDSDIMGWLSRGGMLRVLLDGLRNQERLPTPWLAAWQPPHCWVSMAFSCSVNQFLSASCGVDLLATRSGGTL